jgi:hypothetical protein
MTENGIPTSIHGDLTPIDGGIVARERRRDPGESLESALEAHGLRNAAKWRRRFKIWILPILTALGGGTWGAVEYSTTPSDVQQDIKKLEAKAEVQEKQTRALGKVVVEGLDHLGKKMDKAHPEVSTLEKPQSLKDAEKEVEEQKTEDRLDEILKDVAGETGG